MLILGINAYHGDVYAVLLNDSDLVAAGAVVTQDVPSRTVLAGNPSQVVREM